MASWPATLPQKPLSEGFTEQALPNTIRSEMDIGPAKLRQRYTATIRNYGMRLLLTKAQIATLETFYDATLASGTATFDWSDHRTGSAAVYRFLSRPAYQPASAEYWYTDLALEVLP